MTGRVILTAEEMRRAEAACIADGTPVGALMERAGVAAAEAIWRFAGPLPALVLCGPGNNGGDGYVIARELAARGIAVRVAALAEPKSDAARAARESWEGEVQALDEAEPAQLLIDSLFGTGLARPLDDAVSGRLIELATEARVRVAVDLPSGVSTDDGAILSSIPDYDLTVTFQTLKPSHLLQPASGHMGRIVVADIGIEAESRLYEIARPRLPTPGADSHKYSRGLVAVIAGELPGASVLAAAGALRAGAGAVRLQATTFAPNAPASVIQRPGDPLDRLDDERLGAVLVGPGLFWDAGAVALVETVLACGHPLVLDAGALAVVAEGGLERLRKLAEPAILTPHEGEFRRIFSEAPGSKVDRARAAAARAGAVIVYKGADTVVAAPDGRAAIHSGSSHWLASGGTGDVLAGAIAALRASRLAAFDAACAGVWLHGRAGELAGPALIADDLPALLPAAIAECL